MISSACGSILPPTGRTSLIPASSATNGRHGSSVWGKKEMVCPEVDNANVVSTFEGGTNLFWAERLGKEMVCRALDQAVWQ